MGGKYVRNVSNVTIPDPKKSLNRKERKDREEDDQGTKTL